MRWRLKDGKHVDSTVLESLIMDTEYSGTLFIRMAPDAHLTNEKKGGRVLMFTVLKVYALNLLP